MAEQKTKPTGEDVEQFLNAISDERRRQDSFALLNLMQQASGLEPKLWRGGIVGFGEYHYKYASGHEGDAAMVGFAPRKGNLVLYVLAGVEGQAQLLERLGKHKAGKGCLYINRMEDVDPSTLSELVRRAVEYIQQKYPWRTA